MKALRIQQVATKVGDVHTSTILRWEREKTFPASFLLNGVRVWDEAEVDQFLQQRKEMHRESLGAAEQPTG